jgi:hypothetical protein
MELKGSLPHSQEPTTGAYPELNESSHCIQENNIWIRSWLANWASKAVTNLEALVCLSIVIIIDDSLPIYMWVSVIHFWLCCWTKFHSCSFHDHLLFPSSTSFLCIFYLLLLEHGGGIFVRKSEQKIPLGSLRCRSEVTLKWILEK